MPVRKWMGDLLAKYPNLKLVGDVSDNNKGCTECRHILYIPCLEHPYCINSESESYGRHYHSWDVSCKFYEEGERYEKFTCSFYDGSGNCKREENEVCLYEDVE